MCSALTRIQITPFSSVADYERMLDYFLEARLAERQRASAALI